MLRSTLDIEGSIPAERAALEVPLPMSADDYYRIEGIEKIKCDDPDVIFLLEKIREIHRKMDRLMKDLEELSVGNK
jgi:hypothetical protein